MNKSYIADNIMREYERKKRYEANIQRRKLQQFIKENCSICKNKKTQLCHIVKDNSNEFSCSFKNI